MTRVTFASLTEGWVFCGYRILLYKWERAAALVSTNEEMLILGRIAMRMRGEMRKDLSQKIEDSFGDIDVAEAGAELIAQTNGARHAGPVIGGRFQVMGSWVGGTFYVVDHARDDLLLRVAGPASDALRFSSIGEAETHIKSLQGVDNGTTYDDSTAQKGTTKMSDPLVEPGVAPSVAPLSKKVAAPKKTTVKKVVARAPPKKVAAPKKVNAKAPALKAVAPKKVAASKKAAAKTPAPKVAASKKLAVPKKATAKTLTPKGAAPNKAPAKLSDKHDFAAQAKANPDSLLPPAKADALKKAAQAALPLARPNTGTRPGSVRAMYEDLIFEHKLTDKEIVKAVADTFPVVDRWDHRAHATKHQSVAWYRASMRRRGNCQVPDKVV